MTGQTAIWAFLALTAVYVLLLQFSRRGRRRRIRRKWRHVRHPIHPRIANRKQRAIIYRRDGGRCHYCLLRGIERTVHPRSHHRRDRWTSCDDCGEIDHKHAHARGGTTTMDNLVLACFDCNRRKGVRSYDDFVRNG